VGAKFLEQRDRRFQCGLRLGHRNQATRRRDGLQRLADFTEKPTPGIKRRDGLRFLDLSLGQRRLDFERTTSPPPPLPLGLLGGPASLLSRRNGLVGRFLQPLGEATGLSEQAEEVGAQRDGRLCFPNAGQQSLPAITGQVLETDTPLQQVQVGNPPGGAVPGLGWCQVDHQEGASVDHRRVHETP
jgi:hypothetical protein